MAEKRKRCSLSVAEKRKIINYVNENPLMKKIDIAKKFEIPSSTLATILKSKELTDADIVASVLPVATEETEEGEEDEDKTNQIDFTITDAQNALNVIKYVFLKKGGLSDSVVKSITELDCALDITNPGKQTTIYDYFSSKDTKNDD